MTAKPLTFQKVVFNLQNFWAKQKCTVYQPYDVEMGAGTFHPITFFSSLSPEQSHACYVQGSRRPKDGRYGENPNRLQHYYQFQVLIKPSPENIQDLYLKSLESLSISITEHDIRFVEDDWESPTLGAAGLGWEVWLDGMEISQFTYFQQMASIGLKVVPVEITYGLERISMYIQNVDNFKDIAWDSQVKYRDIFLERERQFSKFNFESASISLLLQDFKKYEEEAKRHFDMNLIYPGYDYLLKCSHLFNLLDARGAISVTERALYIKRIRALARECARIFLKTSEKKDMSEKTAKIRQPADQKEGQNENNR
ncbi:MAG: glycine--tRNA ligase subunit alpha [Candidatus Cloacimonadia bacterium]